MILERFLLEQKQSISSFLTHYLTVRADDLVHVNALGNSASKRLLEFSLHGKMVRGSLVCAGVQLANKDIDRDTIVVGAAMELIHTGLLIHDDIMDHDPLRRGLPTMHTQFSQDSPEGNAADYGVSQAISVGDIAYFMALSLIHETSLPAETKSRIVQLIAREIQKVGVAQMYDVYSSHHPTNIPDTKSVELLYTHKTAHYTISLPLALGIVIGEALDMLPCVFSLGEHLGTLFQIQDDYLGLWGKTSETGKPVLNDIKEKKKTLYLLHALKHASPHDHATLMSYLVTNNVTSEQARAVLEIMEASGAKQALKTRMSELADTAMEEIINLKDAPTRAREILKELVAYLHHRTV